MDQLLREYRAFARAYVDDVVVLSKRLGGAHSAPWESLPMFQRMDIALKPSKTYLGYRSVALPGQKVDIFGLTTAEEKLEAISKLKFPGTLKQLETTFPIMLNCSTRCRYARTRCLKAHRLKAPPGSGSAVVADWAYLPRQS